MPDASTRLRREAFIRGYLNRVRPSALHCLKAPDGGCDDCKSLMRQAETLAKKEYPVTRQREYVCNGGFTYRVNPESGEMERRLPSQQWLSCSWLTRAYCAALLDLFDNPTEAVDE